MLEKIQKDFNAAQTGDKKVSLADLIVLGGCAAVEEAAKKAGHEVRGSLHAGTHRRDAGDDRRRAPSPCSSRPRTASATTSDRGSIGRPEEMLVDRAQLLTLTAPEMTVLVGGMRVLDTNFGNSGFGVFTKRPGTLTNDFFVNLLDMSTEWKKSPGQEHVYEGRDRKTGEVKWTGTSVDLVFGSNSQLRAIAEVYASDDGQEKFVKDFVAAWNKVMNLDRFDI